MVAGQPLIADKERPYVQTSNTAKDTGDELAITSSTDDVNDQDTGKGKSQNNQKPGTTRSGNNDKSDGPNDDPYHGS